MKWQIPMPLPSMANQRLHWAKKARLVKAQRHTVAAILQRIPVDPPCVVTLTRVGPRRLDGDNLQAAFKAVRDQVASLLRVDDADERVRWEYRQRPGKYLVEIEVTPCETSEFSAPS